MKVCSECRTQKPIEEFKKPTHNICKVCSQEKANERRRQEKAKWREYIDEKKGCKCAKCGYCACTDALELHHVYPEKKTISFFQFVNDKRFNEENRKILDVELENSIRLCNRCHKEIHAKGGTL